MESAVIAVATRDFEVYHDLSRHLRARGIPFKTLEPGDAVPGHVQVVITTVEEADQVPHDELVRYTTPQGTLEETVGRLKGLDRVADLVIGVDPGERPGLAVVADGHVLSSRQILDPDDVVDTVRRTIERYDVQRVTVRVGHGAATLRDRLVNGLLVLGVRVEVVDETSTSPPRARLHGERDAVAARAIALTRGRPVEEPRRIHVPPGEVRDIQRRSRLASQGDVTISRELATKVARGLISLAEAVQRQQAQRVERS